MAANTQCVTCQDSVKGRVLGCNPRDDLLPDGEVHLLMTGSPCDPFSVQRNKRFADGNVKNHCQFDVTMEKVIQLYQIYEPKKGLFEQVHGFCLPFEAGGDETPKHRPIISWIS